MRVLVTGAAGFVGHHFVEHVLRTTDWSMVGTVSFGHRGCPLRLAHLIDDPRLDIINTDLGAPITERVAAAIGKVDAIVNFASESHVDRSIEEPRPFVLNNVELMLSLLEYARQRPVWQFIQVSTDEVYGAAPIGVQHVEWSPILPSNPYSASKAAQEGLAIAWWRTYGIPVVLTNTMNMIGERQDTEKFLPLLIRKIAAGEVVPIHGRVASDIWHQDRPAKVDVGSRMYLHARNLADAICWLLSRKTPELYGNFRQDRPDRWHIVGEREISNLELAQKVAAIMDKPLRYEIVDFHSARPGHDRRYALDGSKIRSAGWKQPVGFDESLERTVRWTMANSLWTV